MISQKRLFTTGILILLILFAAGHSKAQFFNEQSLKFNRVLNYLQYYYVDSINQEEIVEDAIEHVLHELDPHSTYISAKEVKQMQESLQGNFEGIGISFNILNDTIYVVSTIPGGPSEKVGVQAGDRIVKVNGETIAGTGITNSDVFDLLRGEKGTKVTISVKRKRHDKLIKFTITRDKIPLYSVDASYMIDDETGYIKINRFSQTTMDEFEEALESLEEKGLSNLVLDLSNNGGGYLEMAIRLADEFLKNDRLIVYTKGLHSPRNEYDASMKGNLEEGKVVIMIDEGSASASEIVSGAVQDWDRGVIVGRRSFGKGLVQKQIPLNDSSMIRLTVARYYTPTGRLIQKPYENGYDEYALDILERYNTGELTSMDSIEFPDSLKYHTLINERPVYGGGGIMPDIFVPLDTTNYTDYYEALIRNGVLYRFALEYVDNNRQKLLKKYGGFDNFKDEFMVDQEIINDMIEFAEDEELDFEEEEYGISELLIKNLLMAYIVRDLFNTTEFYQILNQQNDTYNQAVRIINDEKRYNNILKGKK